jgi:uncharacterized protein
VPFDEAALTSAGERLQEFAATLPQDAQAALRVLLERGRAEGPVPHAPPPASIFEPAEAALIESLAADPDPAPGDSVALTVIMKSTRLCNLRCTYCHSWRDGPNQTMTFPVLAHATRDALRDPGVRSVDFVWHGGEATLVPRSFYSKALWLQERFRRSGQTVVNTVQTNGTRLTDDWLAFLREHDFSVGVSLDGPPEVHDTRRLDAGGRPTSARVRKGLERLQAAGITRSGTLMVVDEEIRKVGAQRLLEYMVEIGVRGVALLNVLPENTQPGAPPKGDYLPFPSFVDFLRDLFHVWWPTYRDRMVVRELADLAGQLTGEAPRICVFAGECFGTYLTVEPTGEVSACDKYIDDGTYRFGDVLTTGLTGARVSQQLSLVREENRRAVERMRDCRWFGVCHGGCPHDRYTGERRLPRYDGRCCGLAPLLDDMAATLEEEGLEVVHGGCSRAAANGNGTGVAVRHKGGME